MAAIEIKPHIFWIGVNDRDTDLFEGLWPIDEEGVSYNSYLINDDKKAIIDLANITKTDVFLDHLSHVVNPGVIDYLIINHMEPDHTGLIKALRKKAPNLTIYATSKAKKMLSDFYQIEAGIEEIEDGQKLSLGETQLQFFEAPFVHWPETMVTYETSQKVLFSCDAFGGYGAVEQTIFDDECKKIDFYEQEALRYFVNIIAKYTNPVLKAIDKVSTLDIDIVAPSHGLIWRKNPERIIDLYKTWAQCASGGAQKGITFLYGSMYGNTKKMVDAVARGISSQKVPVNIFDAARTHISYILPSLWSQSAVVIGAPTYEGGLFPGLSRALQLAVLKKVRNKKAMYFGSYGWSGGAFREIKEILKDANWNFIDSIEFIGGATQEDLKKGEEMGKNFALAVRDQK